ncbi:MAG: leucine--tRNA ligase [Thermoprotei archaeon]|nr:MAG: leucine--tRNA ligase [Thermoprotei archaeon]
MATTPSSVQLNWQEIEEKWRRRWEEAKVFEADPDPSKPKYYLTVAYPYPNSPQHIGHGRTYTITDVYARFLRMKGFNVLLPMAFHYTGTPILAMARRLASGDEELSETFLKIYKVPEELLSEFTDPLKIARYFHEEIKAGMREIGYSIDWRREFTTIDPEYNRFIEWQFHKLHERGFITKGSHPVGWCPKCQNPVGQHDTKGDVEPEIGQFTLIKFRLSDFILPTATLRPETVFGVTNLWLKPNSRYVKAKVNGETWLISPKCAEKLIFLNFKVEVLEEVDSDQVIGKQAVNPATGRRVLVLPGDFVDLDNATGVVMSVPAHAPYDLVALRQLKGASAILERHGLSPEEVVKIEPIPIISTPGYGEVPAATVVDKMGIKDQLDPKLEDATKELYRVEFHSGLMKDNTGPYAGLSVVEARDKVKEDLAKAGDASFMYELLNRPVHCRCGAECVVKVFEDQWFINYGDPVWKKLAHECLDNMSFIPEELRAEFSYVLDWLKEKACARRSGLGTKLPWDPEWIIESLSDSTIYMAYYTIASVIKKKEVKAEQLTDEVFDYVFLGKGTVTDISIKTGIPVDTLEEMRRQFTYFYPLDSRHSGRDLLWNHLAFMVFNHVAIFPREHWPKQIVVNGSVLMEGKKMSKSMGNIIPLREGIKVYGADPLRLALLISAELMADADFSPALAKSMDERLRRLYGLASWVISLGGSPNNLKLIDKWLLSRLQRYVKAATEAMEKVRVREACHVALFNIDRDLQWYLKRCSRDLEDGARRGTVADVLKKALNIQVRLLAPMAPHLCEEIWEMMGEEGFISVAAWPSFDESLVDVEAELAEELIKSTLEDVKSILEVLKTRPASAHFYVASDWKWKAYRIVADALSRGLELGVVLKETMGKEEFRKIGGAAANYVKRIYSSLLELPQEERSKRASIKIDEYEVLNEAKPFLEKELGLRIYIYREDESKYDPKGKAQQALPYRPAIYLE